jgi:hypothetical protein
MDCTAVSPSGTISLLQLLAARSHTRMLPFWSPDTSSPCGGMCACVCVCGEGGGRSWGPARKGVGTTAHRHREPGLPCAIAVRHCRAPLPYAIAVRHCRTPVPCGSAVRYFRTPVPYASAVRQCGAPVRCASAVRQCRAPVRCAHLVRMQRHGVDGTTAFVVPLAARGPDVPDLHRAVLATGKHPPAVLLKAHCGDIGGVALVRQRLRRKGGEPLPPVSECEGGRGSGTARPGERGAEPGTRRRSPAHCCPTQGRTTGFGGCRLPQCSACQGIFAAG